MGRGERFVRGLAAAVPEAFADVDLAGEYDHTVWTSVDETTSPGGPDDAWARTIALADAVRWIEDHALIVKRRRMSTSVRPGGADPLDRFFAYIEEHLRSAPAQDRGWISVELFEGIPWVEDVLDHLGPRTVELLREAQIDLRRFNRWIGRWSED